MQAAGQQLPGHTLPLDRAQAERQREVLEYSNKKRMEEAIAAEDKRDAAVPLTLARITNNITRCSFINLIIRSGTAAMDLLLAGKPVKNNKCYKLAVRILTMAPQDDEDLLIIKKNLLLFATLSSDVTLTPSKLLTLYCQRLVWQLHHLRFVSKLDSVKLKVLLGGLVKEHGYKYHFGNPKLGHQLEFYVSREQERQARLQIPDDIPTMFRARDQADTAAPDISVSETQNIQPAPAAARDEGGFFDAVLAVNARTLGIQPPEPLQEDDDVNEQWIQALKESEVSETLNPDEIEPPAITPIKEYEGPRAEWTDGLHVQLLEHYINHAIDPFERPAAAKGKAAYMNNAPKDGYLWKECCLYLDSGEKVLLRKFCSHDNMAVQLGQAKLSGQTSQGLVSIIDEVFNDPALPRTKAMLLEMKEEVMDLARHYMKGGSG